MPSSRRAAWGWAWRTASWTSARPTMRIPRSPCCRGSWASWPAPRLTWTASASSSGPRTPALPRSAREPWARSARLVTWWPSRSTRTCRSWSAIASWTTSCPTSWAGARRSATWCWPRTPRSCVRQAATRAPWASSASRTAPSWSRPSGTSTSWTCRRTCPSSKRPSELTDHLLGSDQSWRLADAAWAADFPAGAQQALAFYELEANDDDLDGVIALTTYAVDRLLEVVGPIEVPGYGVTVQPGESTLTLLGETRGTETSVAGSQAHPGRAGHDRHGAPAGPACRPVGAHGRGPHRHRAGEDGPRVAGGRGRAGAGRGLRLGRRGAPGPRRLRLRARIERRADVQVQPRRRLARPPCS